MSDVSKEETDPIGDEILEKVDKEKDETEQMDIGNNSTDKDTDRKKETGKQECTPKVIYDSKKATKKPTTKKPKIMSDNERKQMVKALQKLPKYNPMSLTRELNNTERIEEPEDKPTEKPPKKPEISKKSSKKSTPTKTDDKGETVGAKKAAKKITPIRMDVEKTKKKICDICSSVESYSGSYEDVTHQPGHISSKKMRENQRKDKRGMTYCLTCDKRHDDSMSRLAVVVGNSTIEDIERNTEDKQRGSHYDLIQINGASVEDMKRPQR